MNTKKLIQKTEQEIILDSHNENFTIQHCLRWGLQATQELTQGA